MKLLRPKNQRNPKGRRLREYLTLLCPEYGYRNTWCRLLCEPTGDKGRCGRLAPHAMVGRTQAAIAAYKRSISSE